jgi:hypothetical protein
MLTNLLRSACLLVVLCVVSFPISSCKKNNAKPRAELLIGTWKLSSDLYNPAYDADQDGTTETEAYPLYPTCSRDDYILFDSGGRGAIDQGSTMCGTSPDQRRLFTWSLYNNDHTLVMEGESYALLELSATVLRIAYTFQEGNITYTNTLTFTRR